MRYIQTIHTIKDAELPAMATHCNQITCGFTIYRGVLIRWDEDHDTRVLDILDDMPASIIECLLVIQEHEASVYLLWRDSVPTGYEKGQELSPNDGDCWHIFESKTVSGEFVER